MRRPTRQPQHFDLVPDFICLHPRCGASFPVAILLEAHAIIHANGNQTPNATNDFPTAAGHWFTHTPRLHHNLGYPPPKTYSTPAPSLSGTIYDTPTGFYDPTPSLSGTVFDAPTGFYDPNPGWLNPFNTIGNSDHGHTDPVGNMPSSTITAIGESTFTQGFVPSSVASHGPYGYGPGQPTTAAPPTIYAVTQTSNVANTTGSAQAGAVCAKCGTHVGRQSDLSRHMKKHQPDAQVYRCQAQDCQYSSKRKDKLMEHSRRPH